MMTEVRSMTTNTQPDPTTLPAGIRIAQLEATNTALREALTAKDAHIAMLEERLLHMSVELASSRAREDEQNLMLRRYATVGQEEVSSQEVDINITPLQDDDTNDDTMVDHQQETKSLTPNPVRNNKKKKKHVRRRRKSGSSSVSPYPAVVVDQASSNNSIAAAAQAQPTPIEDDYNDNINQIKNKSTQAAVRKLSSSSRSSSTNNRRFSFMMSSISTTNSSFNDSTKSLNSTDQRATGGVGNIIGNIFHNLDRSDKSHSDRDLSVNFPNTNTESTEQRRVSMVVGQLFRLRKSELAADVTAVEEGSCEEHDDGDDGEQQVEEGGEQPSRRRRPNRSQLSNRHMMSTRLISSTVAFPRVEDDDCLGFE